MAAKSDFYADCLGIAAAGLAGIATDLVIIAGTLFYGFIRVAQSLVALHSDLLYILLEFFVRGTENVIAGKALGLAPADLGGLGTDPLHFHTAGGWGQRLLGHRGTVCPGAKGADGLYPELIGALDLQILKGIVAGGGAEISPLFAAL